MRRVLLALALFSAPSWASAQIGIGAWSSESWAPLLNTAPDTATTGTSEETLYTITIPANTFDKVGTAVRIQAIASLVNNANTKSLRLRDTGTLGFIACITSAATNCVIDLVLVRTNSNSYVPYGTSWSGNGATAAASASTSVTPRDFTGAITVLVQGTTATAAADMVLRNVIVTVQRAKNLSNLSVGLSGTDVRVTSTYQEWTLEQFASGDGAGDWVITNERVKGTNKAWLAAFTDPGMNNTVAFRNGTFIGGSHLNMGTPAVTWTMDGSAFTPSTAPKAGNILELAQNVTGYVGGVPTVSARFRHDLAG
jgi:hypothetical protein